ncbi:Core Sm protein Sm G, spliceosomal U1, U2, U4, and U5 snRNPs component [Komagataella phaffii CBS 7435]|uniref:Small nuclear ribonucleoprotein G n=2 Tax=Komagataella phaffii TaxID=460519 RepID=C4QZ61_KOMPG|nr:Small nuclear ribonucleoprotein G [Komagataella phaffii GS115]CAH2447363.1 Core Sm protein Sm G, spliceosomal U1, U2, U4, and U5 snRNPs component [Komagataella phaffii CBS 7435]CAY68535.1 Small nuclear ribonucleoprotein G [Komagataella phaffii GS115]CCA37596.1 Core Sm protein Sm G, spliceosomal U1, U2, U4, and U5 snRNPs component [Komagataella phaffii CBS 7435]
MVISTPELKKYLHHRISVKINAGRQIEGLLTGYDVFLNLTLDDCVQVNPSNRAEDTPVGSCVLRGNSVISIEALEAL